MTESLGDMHSVDFMSEAMALEPDQLERLVLRNSDLRCTDEDQVVDFLRLYLSQQQLENDDA